MKKAVLKSDLMGNTKIDAIRQKYQFGVPQKDLEMCAEKLADIYLKKNALIRTRIEKIGGILRKRCFYMSGAFLTL